MRNIGNTFILGDSYSTFAGFMPKGYESWYSSEKSDETDVNNVEQTWWKMFFNETEANLVLNCSWSGTTICNTGYGGCDCSGNSFIGRLNHLIDEGFFKEHPIDTFIVFGGTNDSWSDAPIGELMYSDWKKADLFSVLPAIGYLLDRLKSSLPKTRIVFVINTELKPIITDSLKLACEKYGVETVVLKNIDKQSGHPNISGMKQIKEQILNFFKNS